MREHFHLITMGNYADNFTEEKLDFLVKKGMLPQPDYIKIDVDGYELKILKGQQSNKLKALTEANCWGIFESGKTKFKVGDFIECLPLIPSS